jgi:hypothetical protein
MLHSAVRALPAFAVAMVLDLRVSDATAISTDLYLSEFCVGCTSLIDNTIKPDLHRPISIETTTHDLTACKHYGEPYCENFSDNLSAEAEIEIITSVNAQLGSETSDLKISVEHVGQYQENSGCTYFESKLRDPRRVREECGNVESGSDHLELVSMLTLTTVSMISFALLAGVWLLRRSFRNWHLRKMILRDKTTSNLQIRKGRRRSGGPIRG